MYEPYEFHRRSIDAIDEEAVKDSPSSNRGKRTGSFGRKVGHVGMSLQKARERKLSCSDGALNIRQQLIANHHREEYSKSKDENYTNNNNSNSKHNNRLTKRRKDGITNIPEMMTRFLKYHNNNNSNNNNNNSNSNNNNNNNNNSNNTSTNNNQNRRMSIFQRMLPNLDKGNIPDRDNAYFLRYAVRKFDTERVIELVSNQDTDINGSNQRGISSLHEAAIDGNFVCMKILVSHGADINRNDFEGFTPLDYAVFGGNFECAAYLIEKGAVVDRIRDGQIVNKQQFAKTMSDRGALWS